jgi:hypothetical protein
VLGSAQGGYLFEDELFSTRLGEGLTAERRRRAHQRVGRFLLSQELTSKTEELQALVHLMEGGDVVEAPARITRIAIDLMKVDPDHAIAVAPAIGRALALFRALGKPSADQIALLVPLSVSGYFSDLRLAKRYGDEALVATTRALCIDWILKLTPWLGKRLSLALGFAFAALRTKLRRSACAPSFRETIELFFHSIGAHAAVSTICVNAPEVARCARLTSPFTVLGKRHIACFVHEFNTSLWLTMRDHTGHARERWQATLAQLEGSARIEDFPEHIRIRYLGGALYALGFLECWRDSPEALRIADRLESFELKMYHMSADQLRTVYYGNQGNRALYERYKSRAELHAIQRGSAWQVETWAPGAAITAALRSYDAMGLKESYEQLLRLQRRIPSMQTLTRRCRGAFLYLRKRYAEALPVLEECLHEVPLGFIGWGRAHGMLAACLNALGQPQRAKQICQAALSKLSAADLMFPAMNLSLQIELAHAEAQLGNCQLAAEMLDALLAAHAATDAPLTMGALREARARVALLAGDQPACELHVREMERRYMATDIPSLVARCDGFARERRHALRASLPGAQGEPLGELASTALSAGLTTLERALSQLEGPPQAHAQLSLNILGRSLGEAEGALFGVRDGQVSLLACLDGREPPPELQAWVVARLGEAHQDDVTQTDFVSDVALDLDVFQHGNIRYRLFPLRAGLGGHELIVGAAVFPEPEGRRHFLAAASLYLIAQRLHRDFVSSVHSSIAPRQARNN